MAAPVPEDMQMLLQALREDDRHHAAGR
jgi:hypothetical protein